jgi:hypothetical protein
MFQRPWPLVILAVIQMLSPIFNVLVNSWTLGVKPNYVLGWIMERPPIEIFEFFLLMPIAGFAILRMRRWSYIVFFGAMAWSLFSNLRHLQYTSQTHSVLVLGLVYGLQIALVLYFLLPSVRVTYFNPRVRWWESKPRYELKLPCELIVAGNQSEGNVLNVSAGGIFVQVTVKRGFNVGADVDLRFSVLSQVFKAQGKFAHERELGGGVFCYGIQFNHSPETRERFQNLTRALEILEFQIRAAFTQSFFGWFVTLLKTGKGLTPQIKRQP